MRQCWLASGGNSACDEQHRRGGCGCAGDFAPLPMRRCCSRARALACARVIRTHAEESIDLRNANRYHLLTRSSALTRQTCCSSPVFVRRAGGDALLLRPYPLRCHSLGLLSSRLPASPAAPALTPSTIPHVRCSTRCALRPSQSLEISVGSKLTVPSTISQLSTTETGRTGRSSRRARRPTACAASTTVHVLSDLFVQPSMLSSQFAQTVTCRVLKTDHFLDPNLPCSPPSQPDARAREYNVRPPATTLNMSN